MKKWMNKIGWIINTILGGAIFALGFYLFLLPHELNAGGENVVAAPEAWGYIPAIKA